MENNRDNFIEEALTLHESGAGLEVFLSTHPEIADEVRDIITIQNKLRHAGSDVTAPRDAFMRVLKQVDTPVASALKQLPSVSPYFSMPLYRIGVPALLLLIIVLGVSNSGGNSDVATLENAENADVNSMSMRSVSGGATSSEGEDLNAPAMMSMKAMVEEPQPVPATGSIDDLLRALEEDANAEIAAATVGDDSVATALSDADVLQEYVNVYNENQI